MAGNMVIVSILPLVLVAVLSTTYWYPLATASDPADDCELCSDWPENWIKLKYPAVSSGQILVCRADNWVTVCVDPDNFPFSDIDASVACYQLGFTCGQAGPYRGVDAGCFPHDVHKFTVVPKNGSCKIWDEKLSKCLTWVTQDRSGSCNLRTTAHVICNSRFICLT